jgi:hypothetical protein
MIARNRDILIGFIFLLALSLLISYFGFHHGEFETERWLLIALRLSGGPLGGLWSSLLELSFPSFLFWALLSLIPVFLFWKYFKSGKYIYLGFGILFWLAVGLVSVVAVSM